MKKTKIVFFLTALSLFSVSRSFAYSYEEEIKKLQKDISELQSRISDLDSKSLLNDVSFNGRIFFGITDTNNDSEINDKFHMGLNKKNYSNFKMNQVRLGIKKKIDDKISFNIKIRASDSSFFINDAFLKYKISQHTSFDIGQINAIISLENENSVENAPFTSPSRYYTVGNLFFYSGIGFKFNQIYDNFGLFYGLYGNSYDEKVSESSKVVGIFRAYYNPYKYDNNLIHLGINYYFGKANYKKDVVRVPDGSSLFYTISDINNFALEFALNHNSFNFQSEFVSAIAKPSAKQYDKNFTFYNYYLQASYLLTGEILTYSEGSFGSVDKVLRPITSGGLGAFEVAVRYSRSDMNDEKSSVVFDYGIYDIYSLAFNWMPIDNAKVIFEYSRVHEEFSKNSVTSIINKGLKNNYDAFNIKFKLFF